MIKKYELFNLKIIKEQEKLSWQPRELRESEIVTLIHYKLFKIYLNNLPIYN